MRDGKARDGQYRDRPTLFSRCEVDRVSLKISNSCAEGVELERLFGELAQLEPVAVDLQVFSDAETRQLKGLLTRLLDRAIGMGGRKRTLLAGEPCEDGLSARLGRISVELQALSFTASLASPVAVALDHDDLANLSPREREVLSRLVSGLSVPAIAQQLHVSPHTVRNHLKSMFRKLVVGSQAALIERVRNLGGPANGSACRRSTGSLIERCV